MEHTGTLAPIAAPPRLSARRLGRAPTGSAAALILSSVLPIAVTALGVTVLALGLAGELEELTGIPSAAFIADKDLWVTLPQPAEACELRARQAHAA